MEESPPFLPNLNKDLYTYLFSIHFGQSRDPTALGLLCCGQLLQGRGGSIDNIWAMSDVTAPVIQCCCQALHDIELQDHMIVLKMGKYTD